MIKILMFVSLLAYVSNLVHGHGMVLLPVNRASRWRYNNSAPVNYDDNGLYCGGYGAQWDNNGGKCGVCGDNYADPVPRLHELGGVFGQGVIVEKYPAGSQMFVQILVTANHLGYFSFNLCNIDQFSKETDECFAKIPLKLIDGRSKYEIEKRLGLFDVTLQLPAGVTCKHCVLQWTWTTGNSWGSCGNGCGEQETFRTCSDIAITN